MNKFEEIGQKTEYIKYDVFYDEHARILTVKDVADFDLTHIFECGQCFRWTAAEDGAYVGVAGSRMAALRYENGVLKIENCGRSDFGDFWKNYLDLERDYGALKLRLSEEDEIMKKAAQFGGGIRLLKQDPWETVVTFILSQNSNIPRIRKCVETLCENFGKPLGEWRGVQRFGFPPPERLAELTREELAVCRLGYRDKYVIETARKIVRDGERTLAAARDADPKDALEYLLSLPGVGPKVADCIMLFGLLHYGSFPLDVWMKRIMSDLDGYAPGDAKGMSQYAREHFGEVSGFAQQYLFYYAKENLKKDIDNKR